MCKLLCEVGMACWCWIEGEGRAEGGREGVGGGLAEDVEGPSRR